MMYISQIIQPLKDRWRQHIKSSKPDMPINRAIKKYGVENFICGIIDTATSQNELNLSEQYHILFLNTLVPNGYNISEGGTFRPSGWKHTSETKEKIRVAGLGRTYKHTDAAKIKMSKAKKNKPGRVWTNESRAKLSATRKTRYGVK